ncbi:MAG: zinc-binding dehydrogenase [Acidimicrobiales bacterium]
MRAAALRSGQIHVRDDLPEPEPGFGQILVQVEACGICGSDLHFAKHGAQMLTLSKEMSGLPSLGVAPEIDLDRDVFMGHEFSAEVLEIGPDTVGPPPGTLVTSIPILFTPRMEIRPIVYSNDVAGGYGERMLLAAPMIIEVPNGLGADRAALTEPMAVGLHAVNKSGIGPIDSALVLGCGPVGLAVVAALRLRGVETIVATDFSPTRRSLAATMGATEVVDPAAEPAFEAWQRVDGARSLVVFEAVGVPGMLDGVLRDCPAGTRVLVVGVCMEQDRINPFFGIAKELNIQFALGYDPMEFQSTLHAIAEGQLDVAPLITGTVDLDGVAGAFAALADPDEHCKILVLP